MWQVLVKNVLLVGILVFIYGCTNLYKVNTVSAPPWDYWEKPGYTKNMIQIFLNENCRYSNRPKLDDYSDRDEFLAEYKHRMMGIESCMLENGFTFTLNGSATPGTVIWDKRCDKAPLNQYPACLSLKNK